MNKAFVYILIALSLSCVSCYSQNFHSKKDIIDQKGVLIYYMNEPYFFPTMDTAIEIIGKSKLIGLKLGKIKLNDIYDSIAHKLDVIIYVAGDKNKIDTVKSRIGILLVKMKTKLTKTKLSPDTAAFNFEYTPNHWTLLKYETRFDREVISIEPLLAFDIKERKKRLKNL